MKLTIDRENKTVQVDSNVNLGELVTEMKELGLDWKDFRLDVPSGVTYVPYYPYDSPIVQPYIDPLRPYYGNEVKITCSDDYCAGFSYTN